MIFHVISGEPLDRIRAGNTERMVAGEATVFVGFDK
jgi:hypothetical protein